MGRLILVRHGESEWNVEGRVQGQATRNPLTATGIRQAEDAAERLVGCGASVLVASDLERAAQTAAIIGRRVGLTPEFEAVLREQDAGSLTGRLARELRPEEAPEGVHLNEVRWGGGESIADVHARLSTWWDAFGPRLGGGTAIVVSHGIALQVVRAVVSGRGPREVGFEDALCNGDILALNC